MNEEIERRRMEAMEKRTKNLNITPTDGDDPFYPLNPISPTFKVTIQICMNILNNKNVPWWQYLSIVMVSVINDWLINMNAFFSWYSKVPKKRVVIVALAPQEPFHST